MDKSEITKFREALRKSEVKFTYTKKDGTERLARGTICEELLPKVEPIVAKFHVVDMKWDPKGGCVYPHKCKVCVTQKQIDEWGVDAMDNVVESAITAKFGATPIEFEYYKIDIPYDKPERKLPEGSVFYYDLDKQGYRSFNESQLVSWSC